MKVILDTNVFISGIFWEGNYCSQIIGLWRQGRFELVSSKEIIQELVDVLKDFKIKMPEELITEWQRLIRDNSIMVNPSDKLDIVKDDPSDNKFFEAAVTGDADCIVSQNKHVLRVKYKELETLLPEEFLKKFFP